MLLVKHLIAKNNADDATVSAVIIMIGSNDNGEKSIKMALDELSGFGFIQQLAYYVSQDHTKKSSKNYHNQAVILYLTHLMVLSSFIAHLKQIEKRCGRCDFKNVAAYDYLVAMDLDVMAVMIEDNWRIIQERCPLKDHEQICLSRCFDATDATIRAADNPRPQGHGR